jgi:hypothetical protein
MFVDGRLDALLAKAQVRPANVADTEDLGTRYFLGHIYFPKSADITAFGLDGALSAANRAVQDTALLLPVSRAPGWGQIGERGFRLAIPGVNGVPARAYLWILILFTALIGPANFFFLWRKRQQVLLVLTVPLISTLFVALLAGYAIAGEGFGVRARAATFTMLDQVSKQAATRASVSLYAAGMSPGGGLSFPRDMAIFPLGLGGTGSGNDERLNLTDSQRFEAGLIRARLPSNFEEIGFRTARERLNFNMDAGRINVANGLGVQVNQLLYRENGKLYTLREPLVSGQSAILETLGSNAPPASLMALMKDAGPSPEKFHAAIKNQTDGSYIAVLDRSPFWEAGVSSFDERGSFHFLVGFLGSER